VETIHKKSSKS